jgi:hypothetical protein
MSDHKSPRLRFRVISTEHFRFGQIGLTLPQREPLFTEQWTSRLAMSPGSPE